MFLVMIDWLIVDLFFPFHNCKWIMDISYGIESKWQTNESWVNFAGCRIKDNVINLYKFTGKFRQMWEAICSISWTFKWRYLPPTARSLQPMTGYFSVQNGMKMCDTDTGGGRCLQLPTSCTPFCNQCQSQSHCLTNPLSSSY